MTQYPELFAALAGPFADSQLKSRPIDGGRLYWYVSAKVMMNRLDDVVGPENWWDRYTPLENSVICELSIQLPDGKVVTKSDAGGYGAFDDIGDNDKSGISSSFRRAAFKFGIGRYLAREGVPEFVKERDPEGKTAADYKVAIKPATNPSSSPTKKTYPKVENPQSSGKALYSWCKQQGENTALDVVGHLNEWAKSRNIKEMMVSWPKDLVLRGHEEANRFLKEYASQVKEAAAT